MILAMENLNLLQQKCYVIDRQTAKSKNVQNSSIKFETKSIKLTLCDYSHVFVLVTWNITVTKNNNTDVAIKTCAPFSACKTN